MVYVSLFCGPPSYTKHYISAHLLHLAVYTHSDSAVQNCTVQQEE